MDGTPRARVHTPGDYEIDLYTTNANKLRAALHPYAGAECKTGRA